MTDSERRERRTQVDLTRPADAERRNPARGRRASDEQFWLSLPASVRESLAAKAAAEPSSTSAASTPEIAELNAQVSAAQEALERAWQATADSDVEADRPTQSVIAGLAADLEDLLAQRTEAQRRASS